MGGEQCVRVQPWNGGGGGAKAVFSDALLLLEYLNLAFEQDWHVLSLAVDVFLRALVDRAEKKYVLWPEHRVWQLGVAAYTLAVKQACRGNYNCTLDVVTEAVFGRRKLRQRCAEVAKVECWLFAHLGHNVPQRAHGTEINI